ncbi:hypothetical protein V2G26_009622 [Clonostachys chloroleuca]
MVVKDILILGAGPCGLATAIALSRANSAPSSNAQPLRITLVELRSSIQTIGGAVNVTPLAMRYLNSLGAEGKLLDHSISLDHGIDYISLRTGQLLGNFWGGIGARRVSRYALVEALLAVLQKEHSEAVEVQWGRRVTEICETADKVELKFQDDGPTLQGDILLGCDGLHSAARRLWVEPEREKVYSGRVVTMGWNYADGEGDSNLPQPMTLSTGEPALVDTSLFSGPSGVILASYYESSRRNVYLSCVMSMDEPETADQNAWKMLGDDKETMRNEILKLYQDTKVKGLDTMISKCESWDLFPIYILPKEGRWHEGRVLLLGDAAHAMPPQGESTEFAIEDGLLIAKVLERRASRSVDQLFADYESIRKPVITKHYEHAVWSMDMGFKKREGIGLVIMEWVTWVFLLFRRWGQKARYSGDVRETILPE